jgi:hypothetical protein
MKWFWFRKRRSAHRATSIAEPVLSPEAPEAAAYDAALELERRLYESAVSSLETTFAKESLAATFVTSGAIVTLASAAQAAAQLLVSAREVTPMIRVASVLAVCSIGFLWVSFPKFLELLEGMKVNDLTDAESFLSNATLSESDPKSARLRIKLQLMAEYRNARINYQQITITRMTKLFSCLKRLACSILLAIFSLGLVFVDSSERWTKDSKRSTSANLVPTIPNTDQNSQKTRHTPLTDMKGSTSKPPIKLPPAGPGTPMIKGGGMLDPKGK